MIESVSIAKIATYRDVPETLVNLKQINYIFGSNGSGKTTISRVIASDGVATDCSVSWRAGRKLEVFTYNRDFIDKNFSQAKELRGIFTLGEQSIDTLNKIQETKKAIDDLNLDLARLTNTLSGVDGTGGKLWELNALEDRCREKCWEQKKKHEAKLGGAFEGYRNNQEKYKVKVLQERTANRADSVPLVELEKKAETIFGPTPTIVPVLYRPDYTALLSCQEAPILKKKVLGKNDVDIAGMIQKLNNSDWVKQGRAYYDASDRMCPFCQQLAPESLAKSLNEYFDDAFQADTVAIDALIADYKLLSEQLQASMAQLLVSKSAYLDNDLLRAKLEAWEATIRTNLQLLSSKKQEPSTVVKLEALDTIGSEIQGIIDGGNAQIAEHNQMVRNLGQEKTKLTAQAWKHVVDVELKTYLDGYRTNVGNLQKAIDSLKQQIEKNKTEVNTKNAELRVLESQTTSIKPTIDGINGLLASYGFKDFSLALAKDGLSYMLLRADGADAKDTLSEGEKTFVTFLYFYHLLKGSESESGVSTDRVVVIDDPVSSLDSDILFVVGSIVKGLFHNVREGIGHIKQIFVLTHNVYFHKEVTFFGNRSGGDAFSHETFWVVRKTPAGSKLVSHPTNPVKTTYELLWAELRDGDRSVLTVQNVMRRILENYFKVLGGVGLDTFCDFFEGDQKLICKSLISWVHDGSHCSFDDLHCANSERSVEGYLEVFKAIFDKTKHMAHFNMMMGIV